MAVDHSLNSRYIAIEGGDGSGKTTLARALAERLRDQGEEVVEVREPGGTALGEAIRRLLLHSDHVHPWAEAFLFAAQRAQLVAELVRPALERGAWVVSDRTYFSSIAYQGRGRGLGEDRIQELNEMGLEGTIPGRVFVLDVETGTALGRQQSPDRIGGEGHAFQEAVRLGYRELAERDPQRVVLLDASEDVDDLLERIVRSLPGD